MKAAWKAFLFTARGGGSLQRKSHEGLLGRATVILSPSPPLAFDSPTSVPWIKEISATAVCLPTMCLVEIQIACDSFPRLFHLLILTTLFSTTSPTVEPSPALPGWGCVLGGWDVALGSQHSLPAAHLGSQTHLLLCRAPAGRQNVPQTPQISQNPWLFRGNSLH